MAGDFNSKVGKRIGSESCIGQWSRSRRNQNGIDLVEFCENNGKIIANSCFQHPAKHITTWSQKRTNPVTKKTISIYNQIDYIILNQKNKQILSDARSSGGTETSSDHRLVVAKMELIWPRIYHKRMQNQSQKRFDTRQLIQNEDIQERYREQIKQGIESMKYKATGENKSEKLKDIIKCAAENNIGYKKKTIGHQISDVDLERMSKRTERDKTPN